MNFEDVRAVRDLLRKAFEESQELMYSGIRDGSTPVGSDVQKRLWEIVEETRQAYSAAKDVELIITSVGKGSTKKINDVESIVTEFEELQMALENVEEIDNTKEIVEFVNDVVLHLADTIVNRSKKLESLKPFIRLAKALNRRAGKLSTDDEEKAIEILNSADELIDEIVSTIEVR